MLRLNTVLNAAELRMGNTPKEIIDFILELDAAVADCGFTQDLIIRLAESFKGDATTQELVSLGNQIANMEGEINDN